MAAIESILFLHFLLLPISGWIYSFTFWATAMLARNWLHQIKKGGKFLGRFEMSIEKIYIRECRSIACHANSGIHADILLFLLHFALTNTCLGLPDGCASPTPPLRTIPKIPGK